MKLFNFTNHPLAPPAIETIEAEVGSKIEEVVIKVYINRNIPITPQVSKILRDAGVVNDGFQSLIVLPGLVLAAASIVAGIHGLTGQMPLIVEMQRDNKKREWFVACIVDLQTLRDRARRVS